MSVVLEKEKGTVSFDLGKTACTLKVTWGAIAAIENDLKCGLVAVTRRLVSRDFGLADVATVLLHGLRAADTEGNPTYEKVAEQVLKVGLLNTEVLQAVTEFCSFALTGGEDPKKDEAEGRA